MELNGDKIKIKDLLDLKRNGMLTVNPEYQRGAVWNETQQKKLIDSVLRGYPLPLIYLHHKKKQVAGMQREDLEIIDGQQRINALDLFGQNALKLFDPVADDKVARFPNFVKNSPCPWSHCDYISLDQSLKDRFDETDLFIVRVTTDNEDEARDLFIRLQAGLPLNAQEKRDAWPGGYTEFVLKFGGKSQIVRYPGHEFFKKFVKVPNPDRGEVRLLCAQVGMLIFDEATKGNWLDLGTKDIDDYYYRNLGFDMASPRVAKFSKTLDLAVELLATYKGPKLKSHEVIHIALIIDSLSEDYTRGWYQNFVPAFEDFRAKVARDKKNKMGEYWDGYGLRAQTDSAKAKAIESRHKFFSDKMFEILQPVRKDTVRTYGQLEREIIYYRDNKKCAVCRHDIKWDELEIHHIDEHQNGGQTTLENGVPVHSDCHPKGQAAIDFNANWKAKHQQVSINGLLSSQPLS